MKSHLKQLNCEQIIARFQTSQPKFKLGQSKALRKSAVIMLLQDSPDGAQVLLCKRPAHLRHHPSQLCFPGGKQEPEDKDLLATALREVNEELGLTADDIKVVGQLGHLNTLNQVSITAFVAQLKDNATITPQEAEVEAVFFVPYAELAEIKNWHPLRLSLRKSHVDFQFFNTPYGLLWGATERLISRFTDLIGHTTAKPHN